MSSGWENMKTTVTTKMTEWKNNATNKLNEIKTGFSTKVSEIKTKWSSDFANIKDKATSLMETAKVKCFDKIEQYENGVQRTPEAVSRESCPLSFTGVKDTMNSLMSHERTL